MNITVKEALYIKPELREETIASGKVSRSRTELVEATRLFIESQGVSAQEVGVEEAIQLATVVAALAQIIEHIRDVHTVPTVVDSINKHTGALLFDRRDTGVN